MKRRGYLDSAIVVSGFLSFMSMLLYFAALHDIWHDYASRSVGSRRKDSS